MLERRRSGQVGQSPIAKLEQLPAGVLLDRIPVPALAVGEDGGVLFVNSSFADMLGQTVETLRSLTVREIFLNMPSKDGVVSAIRERDEHIVELMHAGGWTIRAKMSKSALLRKDDFVALATFQDLTQKLWDAEK